MRARRRVRGRLQTPHGLFLSHKPSHSLIHAHKLELIPSRNAHAYVQTSEAAHTHTHTSSHGAKNFATHSPCPKTPGHWMRWGVGVCAREHGRSARVDPCVVEAAVDVHVR
jgi:hypothetical protein